MGSKAEKKARSAAREAVDQIEQAVETDDPMMALKGLTALLVGIADSLERCAVALEQRQALALETHGKRPDTDYGKS